MGKDPIARWGTCPLGSLSHWLHRQVGPQNSHSDWYRKWGKTSTNIGGRSFPAPTDPTQLQKSERKLKAISLLHKYRSRADEWVALASFAVSPVRFDIFGYISDKWQDDPEMDDLVEKILGPGIPVRADGKQPGRNQSCPCGSGKKFKRCHGR